MNKKLFVLYLVMFLLMLTSILTCSSIDNTVNPYDEKKTNITLILQSSTLKKADGGYFDTLSNLIQIGAITYLPNNIDSAFVIISFDSSAIDTVFELKNLHLSHLRDTAWFTYSFSDTGTATIKAKAYLKNKNIIVESISIKIVPILNRHNPSLDVTGNKNITAGGLCSLYVSAIDSDANQTLSYSVLRNPAGSTFFPPYFKWTAPKGFVGRDTLIVMVVDNGVPPLSDTQKVIITVYDTTGSDVTGPSIAQVSGSISGEVIKDSIVSITVSVTDNNNVDSVFWKVNGIKAGMLTSIGNNQYSLKDTLQRFHLDTILISAQDKSAARNKSSFIIVLDYNAPPALNDTAVSTAKNTPLSWKLNALSIDADPLTWTALSAPAAASGSLTGTLPNATFTPAAGWIGTDSFLVVVKDAKWSDTATVRITVYGAPVGPKDVRIVSQPPGDTVKPGQWIVLTATMNLDVNPAPTYQWKHNGTVIPGALTNSYTIASAAQTDSGSYTVTATNTMGTATSPAFVLHVNVAVLPSITTQPLSISKCVGDSAVFAVAASGTPPLTYQWKKGGAAIGGTGQNSLKIPVVAASDSGSYTCVVSNAAGSATTTPAVLTVTAPPSITTQPASLIKSVGEQAVLSVVASGIGLTYQWRKNGVAISGAPDSNTFTIASVAASDTGSYSCRVSNNCGNVTSQTVSLTLAAVTLITVQPEAVTACAGQSVLFRITATGAQPLTYQWRKNGAAISGAPNNDTFTIASAALSDTGSYSCVVSSGSSGNATSQSAALTIKTPPAIASQPTAVAKCIGENASFTVAASGTAPFTYQWRKDGVAISGGPNSPTYSITAVSAASSGSYSCLVTNGCGSGAASDAAALTVNLQPSIGTQPVSMTKCAGDVATFSIAVTGSQPLTYQWRKAGTAISGAPNAASYTITSVSASDTGSYSCYVSNSCGNATSQTVSLALYATPVITSGPGPSSARCVGGTVTFEIVATGYSLSYQWRKDGVAISGATGATYTINPIAASHAGAYSCRVTNGCQVNVTSTEATLTITPAPTITSGPVSRTRWATDTVTFTVSATGVGTLSYQWKKNGTTNVGTNSSSLYLSNLDKTADNGATFSCVVTNSCGSTTSGSATLTVKSVKAVAASGSGVTIILMNNDSLYGCGLNGYGELGQGHTSQINTPVPITSNVGSIAAGEGHSLVLKKDGTVWSCGRNTEGQLGINSQDNRSSLVQISTSILSGVSVVAAGGAHSLFIAGGYLYACGKNSLGQLGDHTLARKLIPTQVNSLSSNIAAGGNHTLVSKQNGTLWSCGNNGNGQLGIGDNTERDTFVQVSTVSNVTRIAAANNHTLMITNGSFLYVCGNNGDGQLGLGTTSNQNVAIQVPTISNVTQVAAGGFHSLFLESDGTLYACGDNSSGQLGKTGTYTAPEAVLTDVATMSAGWIHSVAVKTNGTLWGCGYNGDGCLGDGNPANHTTWTLIKW